MSVYPSVTKSVFRSVHKSLKVPPAVAGGGGGPAPSGNDVLLETGDVLLLETGDSVLLES